jgi:hypothetical protein
MLYFIANPTTINKIRLNVRIKGDLKLKEFVFIHVRKSNRIKSFIRKRKFNNLNGLASPCKRKWKISKKPPTSTNENITINNKFSANVDIEVSTPFIVDKPSNKVTIKGAMVGALAAINEPDTNAAIENTIIGTLAAIDKPGTNAAIKEIAVGTLLGHIELVSSEVIIDALQLSSQSTPL